MDIIGDVVRSAGMFIEVLSIPSVSVIPLKDQMTVVRGRLKPVIFTASVSASPTSTLTEVGPAGVMTGGTVIETYGRANNKGMTT